MKKTLAILMVALLVASCSRDYRINVTMPDNSTDGQVARLYDFFSSTVIDSAVIENACFSFHGTVDKPFMAAISADGTEIFVVEPGEIALIWDEKTTGTPLNERLTALSNELDAIDSTLTEAEQTAETGKIYAKAYNDNRDNPVGELAFSRYLVFVAPSAATIDSLLATAPAHYAKLAPIAKSRAQAAKRDSTAVGSHFVDFTVNTHDGKTFRLSDYVGRGKVTILDLWASWCPSCVAEIPNFKKILADNPGKVDIVSVTVREEPAKTLAALDKLGMTWPVIVPAQEYREPLDIYGQETIPGIFVFSPDGTLLARNIYGPQIPAAVATALSK